MKYINFAIFHMIRILVLYLFYLIYLTTQDQVIFVQMFYVLIFSMYYFCRDINLEFIFSKVSYGNETVLKSIIHGFINLIINYILMFFIVHNALNIVLCYFIVNYIFKVIFDQSIEEIIFGTKYIIEESNAYKI